MTDVEFFFDPVCPYCWVTSQWVRTVRDQRGLDIAWRFISLAQLNEGGYENKPAGYPDAHHRGLEMLRVAAAARDGHGPAVLDDLYPALGQAVWETDPPAGDGFDGILEHTAQAGDLKEILHGVGLPPELATAADDDRWDETIRRDTEEALERVGDGVGTPILSFEPPDGPAFFGPVISDAPEGEDALVMWDAITTLARWEGFAELKRSLRTMPRTRVTGDLAGSATTVS